MAKPNKVAEDIKNIIKEDNIISFTNCMTRLRLNLKTEVDIQALKEIDGVMGVINQNGQLQIILGPGFVSKVANEFAKIVNVERLSMINENMSDGDKGVDNAANLAKINKSKFRGTGGFQSFVSRVSRVFTPLIPVFIAAGLLSGFGGIIASSVNNDFTGHDTLKTWNTLLTIMMTITSNIFIVMVGWKIAEEFGGSPAMGALLAALYMPAIGVAVSGMFVGTPETGFNFLGIHINDFKSNWLTVGFVNVGTDGVSTLGAPHAGLIGAMASAGIGTYLEKQFRRFMPGALDTVITPTLVVFIMIFANLFSIIPLAGYVFTGISWFFSHLYANPFGAAFLASLFLITVVFGVHQGFLPVYAAIFAETGVNGLFPILAMGGAAQVGVALMMWIMAEKGSVLRKQIIGAIIPGFIAVGEPLIYGITLPRIRPFVISCIAASVGGFYIGALNMWGGIGFGLNSMLGPSALAGAIMMTTADGNVLLGIGLYLSALLLTYLTGALFCWFGYSKISLNGSAQMKMVYTNKEISMLKKVLYSLAFITIIGIFITWIVWYVKMDITKKQELKSYKFV